MLFLGDPVDVLVRFYYWMRCVDEDDFEPLVSSVFAYPVAVKDFGVGELASALPHD